MAVPDYQSLMLPLLKTAADKQEHRLSETTENLALQLHLTDQDRNELLPSGKQRKFDNRVHWARTYLVKAKLLTSTGRSKFCITERGISVLKDNPLQINVRFLKQFPEFLEFVGSKENKTNGDTAIPQEI